MSQQNVSQSGELPFEPHTQVEEVVGAQAKKRALGKSYAMYCSFKSLNIAMQYGKFFFLLEQKLQREN